MVAIHDSETINEQFWISHWFQLFLKFICKRDTILLIDYKKILLRFWSYYYACQVSQVMNIYVGMGNGGHCGGWVVRSPLDDIPSTMKAFKHIAMATTLDLSNVVEHCPIAFGTQISDLVVCKCRYLYHFLTHA